MARWRNSRPALSLSLTSRPISPYTAGPYPPSPRTPRHLAVTVKDEQRSVPVVVTQLNGAIAKAEQAEREGMLSGGAAGGDASGVKKEPADHSVAAATGAAAAGDGDGGGAAGGAVVSEGAAGPKELVAGTEAATSTAMATEDAQHAGGGTGGAGGRGVWGREGGGGVGVPLQASPSEPATSPAQAATSQPQPATSEPHAPDKPANATLHCAALLGPCYAKPLALSVFCPEHILLEPRQRLYRPCARITQW